MQFHGEYQHRVDPQGRVAIPARYREEFSGGIYLTRGFDQCIWAFSPDGWESYSSKYAEMSPNSLVARTLRRRVFGSTFDLELDRQGRVVLPQPLRQFAGLQEEVVIVGAGTWLELWDSSRWDEMMVEIDAADMDFTDGSQEAGA
jgi:MraZ protein